MSMNQMLTIPGKTADHLANNTMRNLSNIHGHPLKIYQSAKYNNIYNNLIL